MNDELKPLLARLPEPAAPPSLAATVMARIAREAGRRRVLSPVRHDWPFLFGMLAGAALVIAAGVYGWVRTGGDGPLRSPLDGAALPVVALGLLLYVAGLFAPLRAGGRR